MSAKELEAIIRKQEKELNVTCQSVDFMPNSCTVTYTINSGRNAGKTYKEVYY